MRKNYSKNFKKTLCVFLVCVMTLAAVSMNVSAEDSLRPREYIERYGGREAVIQGFAEAMYSGLVGLEGDISEERHNELWIEAVEHATRLF